MKRERQKGITADRTSNSIDFPQLITIIYINNILQGSRRGKEGTVATGEKHSDGQSVGFFLMPFYSAFLAHFFKSKLSSSWSNWGERKTLNALNVYLLQGKQCKRDTKDIGCLQHLSGEAPEWNHPVCGSAYPLIEEWGCYSNLLSSASTSLSST